MGKTTRLTTEQFIKKAKNVHGDKYDYSLVEYRTARVKVPIICPKHGIFEQTLSNHLIGQGCPKCSIESHKCLVFGIGINDYNSKVNFNGEIIDSYKLWNGMIRRCYNEKRLSKYPTYRDCVVCDEWLYFSKFKKWYDKHYVEGYQLDKDILFKGNKVYSSDTCCLVPKEINNVFTKRQNHRGNLPIGVRKHGNKYQVNISICGKIKLLGSFDTPIDAFNAYKTAKEAHIKEVADKYYSEGKITERVRDAMHRYKVEITD